MRSDYTRYSEYHLYLYQAGEADADPAHGRRAEARGALSARANGPPGVILRFWREAQHNRQPQDQHTLTFY